MGERESGRQIKRDIDRWLRRERNRKTGGQS